MKNPSFKFLAVLILSSFLIFSCSNDKKSDDNPTGPNDDEVIKTEQREGQLNIAEGSTVQTDQMEVVTFAGSSNLDQNGGFDVNAPDAVNYQVLMFNSKTTNKPIYLGLYNPATDKVSASDTSTALALTLFNPNLIYTTQIQREQYLQAVQQTGKFQELLAQLKTVYQTDAENALDYEKNPVIYQLAAQAMVEALESMGGSLHKSNNILSDPPSIEDVAGDKIKFVNPRHIYYGAGIYRNENTLINVATVNRAESLVSFQFGWPPVAFLQPEETEYSLGDGSFKIYFVKGFDFSKIANWDDPTGRATLLNTGRTIMYVLELIIGVLPDYDIATLPNHISIDVEQGYKLTKAVAEGKAGDFLIGFCDVIYENKEEIAYWLFQETQSNAVHHFLDATTDIFRRLTLVLELLGYVNEQGPFVWDLVFAPREATYYITQQNGVISSTELNNSPTAEFSIDPPAGVIGTTFTYNASDSYDDHDSFSELQFRWDWNGDGTFDTGWSSNHQATHSYSESGAYVVVLEVKDSGGLVGTVTHTLNVGGGAGTATHVKLFRDNLPWDSNSMIAMLESLGFTEGTGPNTYEIINSSQFSTVPLIPGEDLIIISNDQNQTFYNNYAAAQVRFTNFVYMGGSMFWEACDQGWAQGSMASAGVVLPGNIETHFDYDYMNYVTNQNLPLVSGLPSQMDHNYASHESFVNLPDGTTIYCVSESNEATLIEFNLGGGWIIVTGQPLEHQYENIYGNSDMEELLPRIVAYFTGKSLPKLLPRNSIKPSKIPTHK